MAGVREEAVNALVTALTPYAGDLSRQDLKMRIEIALSPYDIVAGEHDLTVYQGDINGMPLTTVSRLLGHENIATTQIYLDISDDELELAHRKYVM